MRFYEPRPLWREVYANLTLPNDTIIRDGRFVVLSGGQAHFATQRAFVWIDTKEDHSAAAVYVSSWQGKDDEGLSVTSKTYKSGKELPAEFWADFHKWLKAEAFKPSPKTYRFIDADGKASMQPLPESK